MIRVQVVFGQYTEANTQCLRCGGTGIDPATGKLCMIACVHGRIPIPGRRYTYAAPDGTQLWEQMMVSANGETKRVTVVSLTSDYEGEVREAYPLPRTTMPCPGCGRSMPVRSPCCRTCMERVPPELLSEYGEALLQPGTFERVGALLRIRAWLEESPA